MNEVEPILNLIDYNHLVSELCKQSFYDFVKEFWDTASTEPYVDNWHIEYLCNELEEIGYRLVKRLPKKKDLLINLPPGTSKSTLISIMFPAWLWALDPTIEMICVSYSADLARELASKSRDVISSERYKELFPNVKLRDDKAAVGNFKNTKGGARHSMGIGGSLTGLHGILLLTDDCQNVKQANSEQYRQETNKFIQETLPSRKINKSVAITVHVQQRLHVWDISGNILAKGLEKWEHICLPGELNDSLKPKELAKNYKNDLLDPVRLTRANLDEIIEDQGQKVYNAQVLQSPQYDLTSILKEDWFEVITKQQFKELTKDISPVINFYLDTAVKDKQQNDPSCILACCKVGDLLYITGVTTVKKLFSDLVDYIKLYTLSEGYSNQSMLTIEPRSSGYAVYDFLKNNSDFNVNEGLMPKDDKDARLQSISPRVKGGKVILVQGDWNDLFLSEVTAAQPRRYDQRDVLYMAVQNELNANSNEGVYSFSWL